MWQPRTIERPSDPHATEIVVTLADSGPRYVSDDAEFAVWTGSIGEEAHGEHVRLTGALGHVRPGEQLLCAGRYTEHAAHGWQFAVERFQSALPQTEEGIVLWLTARVPGIGRTFARAIVHHFGPDRVFAELDRDPTQLRDVRTRAGRKLSGQAIERAIAAWHEVATIREVEAFLFAHGISSGLAVRLVRRYGTEVVAIIQEDPYRLTELPRIGFKVADRIARSLGFEPDDARRLQAGLSFVVEEAESDGNTFLTEAELWARAGKLLGVGDPELLESALHTRVRLGELALEQGRIYRTELLEMEQRLGAALAARGGLTEKELFAVPDRPNTELSDEQWSVVELVRTHPLVLLTGLPGAGKTHTQRALVDIATRAHRRVLLCAPTGKAARRMRDLTGHEAMTIHRALGYAPGEGFLRDADNPLSRSYDLVIVDEASMLSLELADALFDAAGDCHVLLVGDTDQLPPIGPGQVLADLIASEVAPRVHLTAIYRQAARSLIIQSARRINAGELPFLSFDEAREALGPEAEFDEDFYFVTRNGPESILEAVLETVCERIPARFGLDARTDVMTLVPMRRGTAGLDAINAELERRLNPGDPPIVVSRSGLRVGSRIVQTKNDYTSGREVMNGEVAFILRHDEEEAVARLSLDDGEREITVPVADLETYRLAWALTVHRAQGSQFPAVVAPWSTQYAVMLSRSLLYTAVTRAQKLCVLAGERKAVAMALARSGAAKRNSALAQRIRGEL